MGLGDRGDDREPEPDAAARARARLVGAVEALEDALGVLRGEAGAGVLDLDHGGAVSRSSRTRHRRLGRSVRAHVAEQVVDDLAQAVAVAEHRRPLDASLDGPLGSTVRAVSTASPTTASS